MSNKNRKRVGRGVVPESERSKHTTTARGKGPSRVLAFSVIVIVLLAIVIGIWTTESDTAGSGFSAPVASAERGDVVYFHRTERCASCLWAEQASLHVVETYFRDELASGRVTFQELDVQKPGNSALARKYRAAGSSLFLNYVKDGQDHIVEAVDTYAYIGNEARFSGRLVAKIKAGLEVAQ